jgi:predicted RNA-binding protein associated with RNAse of E/G family
MIKTEWHDTGAMLHRTTNGEYPVDAYERTEHGLHVARRFRDHPEIRSWEAHILFDQGLQVCRYHPHSGSWGCRYYVDLIRAQERGRAVEVRDLCLDVAIGHRGEVMVIDTDELFEAARAGAMTFDELEAAVTEAHRLLNELSAHGNDLEATLGSRGISLDWWAPASR